MREILTDVKIIVLCKLQIPVPLGSDVKLTMGIMAENT